MPSDKNKTAFNCDKSVSFADKLCTITDDFIATVENIDLLHSAKNINVAVINMIKALASVLYKVRQAYIFGTYHPDAAKVSQMQFLIKKLQYLAETLRFKSYRAGYAPINSVRFNTTLFKLRNQYINAVNCANEIVDISHKHLVYSAASWPEQSVLVGTLRNPKQLALAISNRFYHIPCFLIPDPEKIKCVAIYQSKNLFGNNSGIKYYGRVASFKKIPRNQITEIPSTSTTEYIRFEIEEWKLMKQPKYADYIEDACIRTTLFQLINCRKTSELMLSDYNEYALYKFMIKNAFSPHVECFCFNGGEVIYNGTEFEFLMHGKCIYIITNSSFIKNGVSVAKVAAMRMTNLT